MSYIPPDLSSYPRTGGPALGGNTYAGGLPTPSPVLSLSALETPAIRQPGSAPWNPIPRAAGGPVTNRRRLSRVHSTAPPPRAAPVHQFAPPVIHAATQQQRHPTLSVPQPMPRSAAPPRQQRQPQDLRPARGTTRYDPNADSDVTAQQGKRFGTHIDKATGDRINSRTGLRADQNKSKGYGVGANNEEISDGKSRAFDGFLATGRPTSVRPMPASPRTAIPTPAPAPAVRTLDDLSPMDRSLNSMERYRINQIKGGATHAEAKEAAVTSLAADQADAIHRSPRPTESEMKNVAFPSGATTPLHPYDVTGTSKENRSAGLPEQTNRPSVADENGAFDFPKASRFHKPKPGEITPSNAMADAFKRPPQGSLQREQAAQSRAFADSEVNKEMQIEPKKQPAATASGEPTQGYLDPKNLPVPATTKGRRLTQKNLTDWADNRHKERINERVANGSGIQPAPVVAPQAAKPPEPAPVVAKAEDIRRDDISRNLFASDPSAESPPKESASSSTVAWKPAQEFNGAPAPPPAKAATLTARPAVAPNVSFNPGGPVGDTGKAGPTGSALTDEQKAAAAKLGSVPLKDNPYGLTERERDQSHQSTVSDPQIRANNERIARGEGELRQMKADTNNLIGNINKARAEPDQVWDKMPGTALNAANDWLEAKKPYPKVAPPISDQYGGHGAIPLINDEPPAPPPSGLPAPSAPHSVSAPPPPKEKEEKLAKGGPVRGLDSLSAPRYRVGEKGNEAYVPKKGRPELVGVNGEEVRTFPADGTIVPHHKLPKHLQVRGPKSRAASLDDLAAPRAEGGPVMHTRFAGIHKLRY